MKMGTVVKHHDRVPAETLHGLSELGSATVHEAMGRLGLMKPYMRPIFAGAAVAGSAITVLVHPGDNWMIHVALEFCQPNDVIVVACSADCSDGMIGELIATSAQARGVLGMVLDAGCRDVAELTRMKFPVWSRAISAKGTIKATVGCVNVPVICAGAAVHAGDAVVADDDGVAIIPFSQAQNVLAAGRERAAREVAKRARLQAGDLALDLDNMRPALAKAGVRYFDRLEDAHDEA